MGLLMQLGLLVLGFVLLVKGADFFVDGSSSVAKRLRVPSMIIGLTIVAMGTSLPECSVSVSASVAGKNDLAIANAVGSNLFNLMAACGMCALICPLTIQKSTLKREYPLSLGVTVLLLVSGLLGMVVGRIDGILMLAVFAVFLYGMILSARKSRTDQTSEGEEYRMLPVWKCVLFIIGGAAAIICGGDLVVDSASEIASAFGLSDNLIGLTIVAFGTSLPELVTSVVAAKKKEVDMALGNVIGSNIFNILMVLGLAAAISPIAFTQENAVDIAILIGFSLLTWIFCLTSGKLQRWEGGVMMTLYSGYVVYACVR